AALYPRRFEKPVVFGLLVALLANCNTHSLIIAAMIGAGYAIEGIKERRLSAGRSRGFSTRAGEDAGATGRQDGGVPVSRWLVGAAVMLIGGLAAAVQVYPPPDSIARTGVMLFT